MNERLRSDQMAAFSDILAHLSHMRQTRNGEVNQTWIKYRQAATRVHGEHAIAALIPEEIKVDSNPITLTFNTLTRRGITKWEDLATADFESPGIKYLRGFGEQSKIFARLLKQAAIVRLEIEEQEKNNSTAG